MKKNNLLIEIGIEELPANQILNLSNSFIQQILKNIQKNKINLQKIKRFYTPRRISIILYNVEKYTKEKKIIIKGPEINNSNEIINIFLKNHNIIINDLKTTKHKNKEYYIYENIIKKKNILKLLPQIIKNSISEIHIPKKMKWGEIDKYFIRPINWIIAIFNNINIYLKIYNINSNNFSFGHNLLYNKKIIINPFFYEKILEKKGKVIACQKKRELIIINSLNNIIKNTKILLIKNEILINENTNMTEYPNTLIASYSKKLLQIPKELIINVIEKQQKCFLLQNYKKNFINKLIIISNTNQNKENIIKNYQKVITSRLKDIIFLLNEISNISLIKKKNNLKNIIFHKKLGSIYNKILRIKIIALYITNSINYNKNIITKICLLTKNDLSTKIVKNFPEMHGIIGYNLSKKLNLNKNISIAIKEENKPKFYKDKRPNSISGTILSISDKIDTITGFYSINIIPTGNKDPYFLKRISMGIIEILITNNLKINFLNIITIALKCYKKNLNNKIKNNLLLIFNKRLQYFYENNYKIKNQILKKKNIITNNSNKKISIFLKLKKSIQYIIIKNRINKFISNKKVYNNKINKNLIKTKYEYILFIKINKIKLIKNNNITLIIKYIIINTKNYLNKILILTKNEIIKINRIKFSILINKILSIIY
ncbi:MAG TPA: glycine--tRNA ligase subunit beta [Candidatus Azosocius sp. HAIN]